jgi:hypothetical protein
LGIACSTSGWRRSANLERESSGPKRGRIHPSAPVRNDATAIAASISPTASTTLNRCGPRRSSSRTAKCSEFASMRSSTFRNSRMMYARGSDASGSRLTHLAILPRRRSAARSGASDPVIGTVSAVPTADNSLAAESIGPTCLNQAIWPTVRRAVTMRITRFTT